MNIGAQQNMTVPPLYHRHEFVVKLGFKFILPHSNKILGIGEFTRTFYQK